MSDSNQDRAPHKSVFEKMGDRFASWMPSWYTDKLSLFVIIVCLVLLLMGL